MGRPWPAPVRKWLRHWGLDFVIVALYRISNHLTQFSILGSFSKYKRDILILIWFSNVWIIWKERNDMIIKDKVDSIHHLLDKIKALFFGWLKAKHFNFTFMTRSFIMLVIFLCIAFGVCSLHPM